MARAARIEKNPPTNEHQKTKCPSPTRQVLDCGSPLFALPTSVKQLPCLGHVLESLQPAPQHHGAGFAIRLAP